MEGRKEGRHARKEVGKKDIRFYIKANRVQLFLASLQVQNANSVYSSIFSSVLQRSYLHLHLDLFSCLSRHDWFISFLIISDKRASKQSIKYMSVEKYWQIILECSYADDGGGRKQQIARWDCLNMYACIIGTQNHECCSALNSVFHLCT